MQSSSVLYSVALSLLPARFLSESWDVMDGSDHKALFEAISELFKLSVQDHIRPVYGNDPLAAAEMILDACERSGAEVTVCGGEGYPPLLKEIKKPPVVLYNRGSFKADNAVSIVGTRKADTISREVAFRAASELSHAGCTIVSGMAAGIDRAAHLGALESKGSTCGVLANGIDIMYPAGNADIFRRISDSENSAIISEYPPGVRAGRWTFVRRNRIISGISSASIIVKAASKSGAMITAGYAVEQNRELFVCPGNAYDNSYNGCHKLIREGANLFTSAAELLDEMSYCIKSGELNNKAVQPSLFENTVNFKKNQQDYHSSVPAVEMEGLSESEKSLLSAIEYNETDVDTLIRNTGLVSSEILETLIMLEISGYITRRGNLVALKKR